MTIQFFEDEDKSSSSLPFVNEFVRRPDVLGNVYDIESVTPSRKGNGLILRNSEFMIFIWKKSKACSFVLDAVRSGEEECGYPIVAKLVKPDPHYVLGLDTSRTAFFEEEKDDFTERISYRLVLLPLETSSKSHSPIPKKKGTPQAE